MAGGESEGIEGGGLNATRWELLYGDDKAKEATAKGHSLCGYRDSKQQLIGDDGSGGLDVGTGASRLGTMDPLAG